MSDESMREQIERVRGMASGDPTLDLSPNDIAALKTVLARHDAAVTAVSYLAQRIQDNPDIRYFCGWGTQVFYLTAQAVAVIDGRPFEEVEKFMQEDKQPEYRRVEPEVVRLRDKVHELQAQLDDVPDHRSMRA